MSNNVETILFDMGGTLRSTVQNSPAEIEALYRQMLALLGAEMAVEAFASLLTQRADAYKAWSQESLVELGEGDLWTKWMLPDWPAEKICPLALQLNTLYRAVSGKRVIFPETRQVVMELFRRGYRLGLVSNTTSSTEAPAALSELHIAGCFEVIILSTVVGKRKPDPAILLEAAQRMGVAPDRCAYIGDRVDRDAAAARRAGFAQAIILHDARHPRLEKTGPESPQPDAVIDNLNHLLEIFPPRPAPQPAAVYQVALSTMWAIDNFPTLADFFEAARRMGFAQIELNHKVNTAMLAGIDLAAYRFSSVHAPCPADISENALKKRDWMISSLDEERRREGVRSIQRSIDLAQQAGAGVVVIHAGHTTPDLGGLEKRLRALVDAGAGDSDEAQHIRQQMIHIRAQHAPASFAAVRQSIAELLAYAAPRGVCLGIENRYHYLEHPSPDELSDLLSLAGAAQIGLLYDSGHAETLHRLGFFPRQVWLDRFAGRIVGAHLHDVIGTTDHMAAGQGGVDFDRLAGALPASAFRTCEFQNHNSNEQVRAGLRHLAQHGLLFRN